MRMNVPNALTVGRIGLVPALVLLLLDGPQAAASAVFALGALSDVLDGHIARSRGIVTTFGKLMDPLADKLLSGAAFVALAANGRVAVWIVAVILIREAAVSALRWWAKRRGEVIAANALGKAKAALQTVTILVLILVSDPGAAWVETLVAATVAVTVVSGVAYALAARRPRGPVARHPVTP